MKHSCQLLLNIGYGKKLIKRHTSSIAPHWYFWNGFLCVLLMQLTRWLHLYSWHKAFFWFSTILITLPNTPQSKEKDQQSSQFIKVWPFAPFNTINIVVKGWHNEPLFSVKRPNTSLVSTVRGNRGWIILWGMMPLWKRLCWVIITRLCWWPHQEKVLVPRWAVADRLDLGGRWLV